MDNEGRASHLMENLWQVRIHAGALARCQNNARNAHNASIKPIFHPYYMALAAAQAKWLHKTFRNVTSAGM
jgi:hypothetical protein